ncbi:bifunctional DNA primase/polymerase [Nocardia sp. 2YAB30]|uniref:bifunctional DNA primase/polymerase n=1 Tax=unclassified Nocardia TaxID=2637762 RepID=UPI003F94CFB6
MSTTVASATTGLGNVALGHARRGFHIFPLHPGTKIPAIKQWEDEATRDARRILNWWARWPADNVAIACGPSRVHVLDLDTNHGQPPPDRWRHARDGRDVLTRLAAEAGQTLPVPTYTVSTPSEGGMHLYYRAPREPVLRNTIARLGWRIDSRGAGGYVVAAGSLLPNGSYQVLDDRTPILLPDWLTALLAPPPLRPRSRIVASISHPDAYVRAALGNQSMRIRLAYSGVRHRTVLLAANSLGRLVGAGLLDYDHAYAVLYDAAQIHIGLDDFTDSEAARTITDGLTYAADRAAPLR